MAPFERQSSAKCEHVSVMKKDVNCRWLIQNLCRYPEFNRAKHFLFKNAWVWGTWKKCENEEPQNWCGCDTIFCHATYETVRLTKESEEVWITFLLDYLSSSRGKALDLAMKALSCREHLEQSPWVVVGMWKWSWERRMMIVVVDDSVEVDLGLTRCHSQAQDLRANCTCVNVPLPLPLSPLSEITQS